MKIQATYVANLFEYATYKGVSEDMLRRYLIEKRTDVCNQNNSVTDTEYLNILNALLKATKDINFGVHYGCYLNLNALGFIVQISLNSTSIEQAVFILQNYLLSTFPLVRLEAEKLNGNYVLCLSSIIEDVNLKEQILDFAFCFIYRELKLMFQEQFVIKLEVPDSKTTEFKNFIDDQIKKGHKYKFVFNDTVLNAGLNKRKVKEIEILLPKFLQMLDKKKDEYKTFSIQIRNMILKMCRPELPTFEQVAIQFPLSKRTIQRRLTEEGLSFRKIADDIKNELANYLSKGYKMKTQDIAYLLGYSEASAYLHAAKKWKMEGS